MSVDVGVSVAVGVSVSVGVSVAVVVIVGVTVPVADGVIVPVGDGVGDMVAGSVSVGRRVASGVCVSIGASVRVTSGRRKLQALKNTARVSRTIARRKYTNCSETSIQPPPTQRRLYQASTEKLDASNTVGGRNWNR